MRLAAAATIVALLAAASPTSPRSGTNDTVDTKTLDLSFGVYQSDKATVMYRSFSPVLEAIQGDMKARLGREVDIQLRIYKTYDEAIAAIARGDVDFVRFGPAPYITAKEMEPGLRLIAIETEGGKRRFRGVIVAGEKSPVRTVADLKGRKFAFGDKNSTIGRYLSQAELVRAGIRAKDLASFEYLERHDRVAKAVAIGDFDAGAVKIETFEKEKANGALRVIATFDNVTKPWIARAGLPDDVVKAIGETLCALKDPAVLKELGVSGFEPVDDAEYEFVRQGMVLARQFEE